MLAILRHFEAGYRPGQLTRRHGGHSVHFDLATMNLHLPIGQHGICLGQKKATLVVHLEQNSVIQRLVHELAHIGGVNSHSALLRHDKDVIRFYFGQL